ncbi:MAG: DUF4097 domain-containing protein [Vicinamibacterales bacterium]
MTFRPFAGLLALALTATSATVAAQDRWRDDDLRLEVRGIVRDVLRDVRHVVRDARLIARDVTREVDRAVRDLDLDREWARIDQDAERRRERQRVLRQRRDDARDQTRAARDSARQDRERERDARRFASVSPSDDPCARDDRGSRGHACEVRDTRLPAPGGPLTVDASPNGGIRVEAWDQPDVLVRAVVRTQGDTDEDARALLPRVAVTAAGTTVSAQGPERGDGRRSGWSVGFQIWAPRQTALALTARNGGVTIFGMRGESRFSTQNGGITLNDVGGQVAGHTRNGGVTVRLAGERWEGAGLDVETTNGGVSLTIPQGYSAALEVGTVNGGINTDVPMTVQGRVGRELKTTLGSGGPLVKVRTTNGGVRIAER